MQTLPRQSFRDIVKCSRELGRQLSGIEKRWPRLKRGRDMTFGYWHNECSSSMLVEEGDLVDLCASRRIGEAYEIGENSWKDNDRESFDGSYAAHACVMERLFTARRGFKVVVDEIYRQ